MALTAISLSSFLLLRSVSPRIRSHLNQKMVLKKVIVVG